MASDQPHFVRLEPMRLRPSLLSGSQGHLQNSLVEVDVFKQAKNKVTASVVVSSRCRPSCGGKITSVSGTTSEFVGYDRRHVMNNQSVPHSKTMIKQRLDARNKCKKRLNLVKKYQEESVNWSIPLLGAFARAEPFDPGRFESRKRYGWRMLIVPEMR